MGTARLGAVRRILDLARDAGHADGELLDRYRHARDDDAFGALVRRHGPMVFGVCRRVLRDPHAAADAFQVTFLVLAKRAGAVRPPGVLGAWLYGVAVRTALKARGREVRRRDVERDYASRPRHEAPAADTDLLRQIDAQLAELPEKYRLPLVLCGVEGLGKAEAAERLGLPEGTVSSRLARARDLLRGRLERRGVVVPAALLLALTPDRLRAAVPADLSSAVVETAVGAVPVSAPVLELTREVLAAMSAPVWKIPAAAVAAFAISVGAVGLSGAQPEPAAQKAKGDKPRDERPAHRAAGTLGPVDEKAGTITLVRKFDGGEKSEVVTVAKDAAVVVDGKAAKLGDLKAGGVVEVERAAEAGPATKVAVTGQRVTSVLSAVDGGTLWLRGKPGDRDIPLAAGATVTLNGKAATLADLRVGEPVTVVLTADGSAARSVTAGAAAQPDKPRDKAGDRPRDKAEPREGDKAAPQPDRPKDGEKRPARVARQTGTVGGVDATAGTITLVRKGDGGERRETIPVAKDAAVVVDGKAAKLADVKAKGVAEVELPGERQPATKVTVTGEKLAGILTNVDKTTISVGQRGTAGTPADRKLALAPNVVVTLDGKAAKLADLQTADRVTVTLTTDGTAALVIAAGVPKRDGDQPRPREGDRPRPKDGERP
ncbi:sigma-70 family RNA polymerase sigma factor [bacterium]|nr:sigma-70 family RNA polymerase sigma factor [bacterium]